MTSKYNPKEIALAILAIGIPVVTFWVWRKTLPILNEGDYRDFFRFILPIVGLSVSASLFALTGIFVRNRTLAYATGILSVSIPFFFLEATMTVLGALTASVILVAYAVYRMRTEFDFSLGFSVSKIVRAGLPVYFSISAILIAMFYLADLTEKKALSTFIPRPLVEFLLDRFVGKSGFITDLPPISSDTTIDELILEMGRRQSKEKGNSVSVDSLPRAEREKFLSLQREALSKQFGTELTGEEKVGEAFYSSVTDRIEEIFGPYKSFLPVAAAVAFFIAFKTITWPLYFLSLLLAYLLIKLMVLATIVRREKVTIEVEKLVF